MNKDKELVKAYETAIFSSYAAKRDAGRQHKQATESNMEQKLELTQEWDKVFLRSKKVNHKKVIPWDTLTEFFAKNLK